MRGPEPTTPDGVSDDLELAGKATQELVVAVTGTAPGREVLEWAADVIRGRRARTQIKVLAKTQKMLAEAGLTGHVVPDKTLMPLLEFAGLEDEENDPMLDRWAALLANAASDGTPDVPPSFPDILRQLEPAEAQELDRLVPDERAAGRGVSLYAVELKGHQLDNLVRLGLVRYVDAGLTEEDLNQVARGGFRRSRPDMVVTQLAVGLLMACRRPGPHESPA